MLHEGLDHLAMAAAFAVCTPVSTQADDGYAVVNANGNVVRGR
jgi:hypothetical protein